MDYDAGGGLWLVLNFVAVIILAVAMIYGTMQWHRRRKSRAVQRQRDEATRDLFQEERQ